MHGSLCDAAFVAHDHGADGTRLRYRTWRSPQADAHATVPVLLFLHGSGERGDDNRAQMRVGLGPALLRDPPSWPLLAVFPQLPEGARWSGTHAHDAIAILEDACMRAGGDRARVALTGLSRGGYGVWELALRWPRRFRALLPVCGGITAPPHDAALYVAALADAADPFAAAAARLAHLPCWLVHGARDAVVPVEQSRRMAAALRAAGASVHYRELPEAQHNVWDAAYADPTLWRWLARTLDEET